MSSVDREKSKGDTASGHSVGTMCTLAVETLPSSSCMSCQAIINVMAGSALPTALRGGSLNAQA